MPSAALAASSPVSEAASPAQTQPPAAAAIPSGVRIQPGRSRSTDASVRAWPGLIRAGRRAAAYPANKAATRTVPTAESSGTYETDRPTASGIAPLSLSCPNHQRARAIPGRQPITPARGATSRVSVAMERRI